jgi:signal peptidase I
MNREELRTWLGLRRADLLVYLAIGVIIAMYLINDATVDLVLAGVAILLTLAACPLGMKSSPAVSRATNIVKKIAYPCGVVGAGFFIAFHYVRHYQIPQNGMYPGLPAGRLFLTIRRPYQEPEQVARGDIILFNRTENGRPYVYIWRVVGLPGDAIRTAGDAVIVNGVELNHQKIRTDGDMLIYAETNGEATYEIAFPQQAKPPLPPDTDVTVPSGHFFVLGDNRHQAKDSRYIGLIPYASIIGKKW